MIKNNFKTKYYVPFFALVLLLSTVVNNVAAEELTDEEVLEQYHAMFGNSTSIEEGDTVKTDSNIVRYAPLGEITDEMKIDEIRRFEQAKLNAEEFDRFVEKQVKDRKPLLDTVNNLFKMMEQTDDPVQKTILQNAIDELKPLMAQHGMFLEDDKRDRELVDLWIEKSKREQDFFRFAITGTSFDSTNYPMATNVSDDSARYQVSNYVEYSCSAWVNCKVGPQIWYSNAGGSYITQTGTIPNDIVIANIAEWITEIKNQQSGTVYQGSYHSGSHFDSEWNIQSANTKSLNLWYYAGQTHTISIHSVFGASAGDKLYLYAYLS